MNSFHVLRVGLAITFLWIGLLILKNPDAWTGYLQPWVIDLIAVDPARAMITTGILDIIIGAFLLFDQFVWLASIAASVHLITVLSVSGITDITVRDIGLLASSLVLAGQGLPYSIKRKLKLGKITSKSS